MKGPAEINNRAEILFFLFLYLIMAGVVETEMLQYQVFGSSVNMALKLHIICDTRAFDEDN